jgi:hypothetical protein
MLNTHSREDAFDMPHLTPDTHAANIALRDELLRLYPLTPPKPTYEAYDSGSSEKDWWVIREAVETETRRTVIADNLTEEHAKVFADAMNARAGA